MTFKERWKQWLHRRNWTPEMQLAYLRGHVMQDSMWLANDPVAAALTKRYLEMLSPAWMDQGGERIEDLRRRLGLEPWVKGSPGPKESARDCMVMSSRDWSVDRRDAWLYGVVVGWSDDSLSELAAMHDWSSGDVARLRSLRRQWCSTIEDLRRRLELEPDGWGRVPAKEQRKSADSAIDEAMEEKT